MFDFVRCNIAKNESPFKLRCRIFIGFLTPPPQQWNPLPGSSQSLFWTHTLLKEHFQKHNLHPLFHRFWSSVFIWEDGINQINTAVLTSKRSKDRLRLSFPWARWNGAVPTNGGAPVSTNAVRYPVVFGPNTMTVTTRTWRGLTGLYLYLIHISPFVTRKPEQLQRCSLWSTNLQIFYGPFINTSGMWMIFEVIAIANPTCSCFNAFHLYLTAGGVERQETRSLAGVKP